MTISPRCLRQIKQSVTWMFVSLIFNQYFRWRDCAGCRSFKSSSKVASGCVIGKYPLKIVRMPTYRVKIPTCVFLVVPAIARSHDLQLFLVEDRRKDERLEIAIGQDTDASFRTQTVLQQFEGCIAAGTFNTGIILFAHTLHFQR